MCPSCAPGFRNWCLPEAFVVPREGTVASSGCADTPLQKSSWQRQGGRLKHSLFLLQPCTLNFVHPNEKKSFSMWLKCQRLWANCRTHVFSCHLFAALPGGESVPKSPFCPLKRAPSILFSFKASIERIYSSFLVDE